MQLDSEDPVPNSVSSILDQKDTEKQHPNGIEDIINEISTENQLLQAQITETSLTSDFIILKFLLNTSRNHENVDALLIPEQAAKKTWNILTKLNPKILETWLVYKDNLRLQDYETGPFIPDPIFAASKLNANFYYTNNRDLGQYQRTLRRSSTYGNIGINYGLRNFISDMTMSFIENTPHLLRKGQYQKIDCPGLSTYIHELAHSTNSLRYGMYRDSYFDEIIFRNTSINIFLSEVLSDLAATEFGFSSKVDLENPLESSTHRIFSNSKTYNISNLTKSDGFELEYKVKLLNALGVPSYSMSKLILEELKQVIENKKISGTKIPRNWHNDSTFYIEAIDSLIDMALSYKMLKTNPNHKDINRNVGSRLISEQTYNNHLKLQYAVQNGIIYHLLTEDALNFEDAILLGSRNTRDGTQMQRYAIKLDPKNFVLFCVNDNPQNPMCEIDTSLFRVSSNAEMSQINESYSYIDQESDTGEINPEYTLLTQAAKQKLLKSKNFPYKENELIFS